MTRTYGRAIAAARRVVEDYGISSPEEIDVEAIALDRGLFVIDGSLPGSWARLVRRGNGGLIRVSHDVTILGQRRFCIGHELGHFLLHPIGDAVEESCSARDILLEYGRRPEEPEANAFSGELLMPDALFRPRLDPRELSLARLESLALEFRTTISATAHRAVSVAVHICALVRSENGHLKSFQTTADFPFRLRGMGEPVDGRSCAGEFFREKGLSEREADVTAVAWLDDPKLAGNETVREITIPMPKYGSALTVLWIVPGSELDYRAAEVAGEEADEE